MKACSVAGALAGVAYCITLCLLFSWSGRPASAPLYLFASALYGEAALVPGTGSWMAAIGLAIQLLQSTLLGAFFGLLTLLRSPWRIGVIATLYGLGLWWFKESILFTAGLNLSVATRMPSGFFLTANLIYGLSLLSFFPIERSMIRREILRNLLEQQANVIDLESIKGERLRKAA